jgi:predicted acyltransferase
LSDDVIMQVSSAISTTAPARVFSIDVLRGNTIAFMILVNDPGDWRHIYSQLNHSKWNGCTLTDLVFSSFLFVVGASLIPSHWQRGQ